MHYDTVNYKIFQYVNEFNIAPFELWESNIDDFMSEKVLTALSRVQAGNFSSCKSLGKGLWEIKLVHGAGIRIYFGKRGDKIVLLWGGTKNRQQQDIDRAKKYWLSYNKHEEYIEWQH